MTGLVGLSTCYRALRSRAVRAEAQLQEMQDLVCAFFRERDPGAGDWLRALAEVNAPAYEERRKAPEQTFCTECGWVGAPCQVCPECGVELQQRAA
jgi:hypothetical protein